MLNFIRLCFRYPINGLRLVIAIPFEILRKPILFIAIFFMLGGVLMLLVIGSRYYSGEIVFMKGVVQPIVFIVGGAVISAFFDPFLWWLNPYRKWNTERQETAEFDQGYRFQRYSDARYYQDTGLDVIGARLEEIELLREMAYSNKAIAEEIRQMRIETPGRLQLEEVPVVKLE